jgi:hypothetical protein
VVLLEIEAFPTRRTTHNVGATLMRLLHQAAVLSKTDEAFAVEVTEAEYPQTPRALTGKWDTEYAHDGTVPIVQEAEAAFETTGEIRMILTQIAELVRFRYLCQLGLGFEPLDPYRRSGAVRAIRDALWRMTELAAYPETAPALAGYATVVETACRAIGLSPQNTGVGFGNAVGDALGLCKRAQRVFCALWATRNRAVHEAALSVSGRDVRMMWRLAKAFSHYLLAQVTATPSESDASGCFHEDLSQDVLDAINAGHPVFTPLDPHEERMQLARNIEAILLSESPIIVAPV